MSDADDSGRGDDAGAALAALFNRHFEVVPADTPELLDAAHALRYQVYCVEHGFEDPSQQTGEREFDQYDVRSVHAVLIARASGGVVGCVRLVLPELHGVAGPLPILGLLNDPSQARLAEFATARIAEISRYAISKAYRRRSGENLYPDVATEDIHAADLRRVAPHMSLGLLRGVGRVARAHGIDTVCAAMAPPLFRLLERFGLEFERLGPPIEYHGPRQPCIARCDQLLAGMADRNPAYHRVVEEAYRGGGRTEG